MIHSDDYYLSHSDAVIIVKDYFNRGFVVNPRTTVMNDLVQLQAGNMTQLDNFTTAQLNNEVKRLRQAEYAAIVNDALSKALNG